ncbi:hypothetical protein LTR36_001424 [Oleoguttula mirabilis]|uniref:FMN hydroxy acid dehydrogenase domain-containing protein n=1 Tax=Oleoguttula mirabilis TaxID=1507867 RepID=A0AAV9JNU3_9PEZI|nr:hypothetical protein LTR36_001424 [Oleoguttula mirabilis]
MAKEEEDPLSVPEVELIARKRLPKNDPSVFVLPRVLRDVSNVDTSMQLFGTRYNLPIGIAPSAMHKLVGGEGEADVARAAMNMNVNMTLSSQSTTSLEEVMTIRNNKPQERLPAPQFWFQIYLNQDFNKSIPLIKRAEAAGYEALVLTVDTPVLGNRLNERKTPLVLPEGLRLANIEDESAAHKPRKPTLNRALMDARSSSKAKEIIISAAGSTHSSSLTWETTLKQLRQATSMKVILKGIMTAEDAQLAVDHGADAIVVSNHGGRQLDCVTSTIEALPEIAAAVQGRIPVIVDGGIRHGSDVFKALGLGADFVLVGRPVLWGLAVKGQEGVEIVLNILERELSRTMALAGITSIEGITKASLGVRSGSFGVSRL